MIQHQTDDDQGEDRYQRMAFAFLLRGSGTSANISSKWQEELLVMIHPKECGDFLR